MKTSEKLEHRLDGCAFACEGPGDDAELIADVKGLETELADYKKHFEPHMIQIRLSQSDTVAHQRKTYRVAGEDDEGRCL